MFIEEKDGWFHKISEYVVYVFLLTFPFINYTSFLYFGSVTRSINLIFVSSVLGIFLGFLLLNKNTRTFVPKSTSLLVLFLYVLWLSVSSFLSIDPQNSFYSAITRTTGLWYMYSLGLFLFCLISVLHNESKRKRVLLVTVLSSVVFSVLSFLGPEGLSWIFKNYTGDGFTLGNSTFAGMYLFGSFLLSLFLFFSTEKKKWWHFALPFLLVVNPYILNISLGEGKGILSFLGEARASALALFGSLGALVFILGISKIKSEVLKKKVSYGSLIFVFVAIFFGAVSLFSPDGLLRKFYLSQATSARLLVWEVSDVLIREKPFLGYGVDNFEKTFELNYDSRILQEDFGGEAWFDRAHNVFIDQSFDGGLTGLVFYILVYIAVSFSLLYVIFHTKKRENKLLAIFIIVYTVFHLIELQTAFDTSISYIMTILMFALSVVLFVETNEEEGKKTGIEISKPIQYGLGVVLVTFCFWSLLFKLIPFINSGIINGEIRTVGSAEKRIPMYPGLFATPIDLQALLWRTTTDFKRGISENPKVLEDPKKVENLKKELAIFEEEYRKYTEKNPTNFRALLNYADVKIYFMLFGVNKLEEAQVLLDRAIELVPTAPQPYWMKSVAYLYMQKFDLAREYAKKGLELNPKVPGSQEIVRYVEASIKTFPEIDLYFFRQI